MASILCLETSTKMCSVALSTADGVRAYRNHREEGYSHAEKLHVLIQEVLDEAGLTARELDAVAVAKGPGSFTGLRIGVSTAKGLAYAWNTPLLTCTSLDVLTDGARADGKTAEVIVGMLDARRMEVYTQTYEHDSANDTLRALVVEDGAFGHLHGRTVHFCGDGALKCADLLAREGWSFAERFPEARHMHARMQHAYAAARFEDVAYFEPFYLKDFIAGKPKPSPFA